MKGYITCATQASYPHVSKSSATENELILSWALLSQTPSISNECANVYDQKRILWGLGQTSNLS